MPKYYPYDQLTVIRAAGSAAITATNTNVGTLDQEAQVRTDAVLSVHTTAIKTTAADELYDFVLLGSNDDFTTKQILGRMTLGAGAVRPQTAITSVTGHHELPFSSEVNDIRYQKIRLALVISGTSPSITFAAHVSKRQ